MIMYNLLMRYLRVFQEMSFRSTYHNARNIVCLQSSKLVMLRNKISYVVVLGKTCEQRFPEIDFMAEQLCFIDPP